MSDDPVQRLIDAGAIPSAPFAANSRYQGVRIALYSSTAMSQPTPYVLRRFIPQRRDIGIAATRIVTGGERPDGVGAQTLGDPELYWRVADANIVTDPFELTDTPGRRIAIPLPPGM
jgi:hypothetical protein